MRKLLTLLLIAAIQVGCVAQPTTLSSSDSDLTVSLSLNEGALFVELSDSKEAILSPSPISILVDGEEVQWRLKKAKKSQTTETIPMPYGEFSQVIVPYSDAVSEIELITKDKSIKGLLKLRLFKDAFAYRVELKDVPSSTKIFEKGAWVPSILGGGCFSSNGEHEPFGHIKIEEAKRNHRTPFIYNDSKRYLSFHECDLYDYPQLSIRGAQGGESLDIMVDEIEVEGDVSLPWRVVMVGEQMKDLHNQKPIYQTMSPAAQGDYSWVKPGVSMWDWRVKGTTFDGFTYKMNTESLKRYIDFCSASNIAYFLIDDEWFPKSAPLVPVKGLDVAEVVRYGNEKGVGIILYYDTTYAKNGVEELDFEEVAATYAKLGVAGMKYGFLKSDTQREKTRKTYYIIETLAKHQLVVDFHDGPIPFSGLERKLPNYLSREYCHAQLDRRMAFTPGQFVKMACVNFLAGHMDQTNGTFALNEMATRSKGPRNEYNSTVSSEAARFVTTHTGSFSVLIDAPEAYAQKADLFHVISSIPRSWDETIYIDLDFNSHTAVAKRKGERWFAAVVYDEKGGEHTLSLDFLIKGANYTATIYRDADDAHFKTNKEAYTIESREVTCEDKITVNVVEGGGFTVIFDKK